MYIREKNRSEWTKLFKHISTQKKEKRDETSHTSCFRGPLASSAVIPTKILRYGIADRRKAINVIYYIKELTKAFNDNNLHEKPQREFNWVWSTRTASFGSKPRRLTATISLLELPLRLEYWGKYKPCKQHRERNEKIRWFSAWPGFKKLLRGSSINLLRLLHEKLSLSREKIMSKIPAHHHNEI